MFWNDASDGLQKQQGVHACHIDEVLKEGGSVISRHDLW